MDIQRICVLGNTASGKSMLSGQLAARLNLPVAHLDQFYWRPGWTHVSPAEFVASQRALLAQDAWIIDGTFSEFGLTARFRAADAVIFLDVGAGTCLRRAIARRGDGREDVPADDERLGPIRSLRFLAAIASFGMVDRPRILRAARRTSVRFVRLTSWDDETAALDALEAA